MDSTNHITNFLRSLTLYGLTGEIGLTCNLIIMAFPELTRKQVLEEMNGFLFKNSNN